MHSNLLLQPPIVVANAPDGLFSVLLNKYVAPLPTPVLITLYHAMVIIQALRLNFLFNEQRMFVRNNFLTGMVYILLTGVFKEWGMITPALLSNLLLIWLFAKLVKLYNNPNPKTVIFNIGLIIGSSILLYHPTSMLILLALFALVVVRSFSITEWIVMMMGILAPFYFLFSFLYLTDRSGKMLQFLPVWKLGLPNANASIVFYISLALILIFLIAGLFYWQDQSRRMLIQVRKNWGVLMVFLLVMIPLPFISAAANLSSMFLWIIPVAPFMSNAFLAPRKNILPNIMFWSLVVAGICNNWAILKK